MKEKEHNKAAKIICGIIVLAMIAGILFLTFQTSEQTTKLSETVRNWLKSLGWEMTPKQIRSNVHIPIYFLLGFAVYTFGHVMKWKWYITLLFAIGIALLDESIKLLLSTREFEFKDLMKDFAGISVAGLLTAIISFPRKRAKASKEEC